MICLEQEWQFDEMKNTPHKTKQKINKKQIEAK